MKPTKLLIVSGYPHIISGSQRQLLALLKNLPFLGYECSVLTTRKDILVDMVIEIGAKVFILELPRGLAVFGKKLVKADILHKIILIPSFLLYTFRVLNLVLKQQADIVLCMDERSVVLTGLCRFFAKAKWVWYLQTEQSIGTFFWKICLALPQYIVYNGKYAQKYFSQKSISKHKLIHTVSHLDEEDTLVNGGHPFWLESLKIRAPQLVIVGAFSSVIPYKGYHHLLNATKLLLNRKCQFIVLALGSFPSEFKEYQHWLLQQLDTQKIENFTFAGWQSAPQHFMKYCDIVVLPSVKEEILLVNQTSLNVIGNEGFPTVIMDAMQLGKAVIATNVGGVIEQVVDKETGLVILPGDVKGLEDAMFLLINNPDIRSRMGKTGKEHYDKFFSTNIFIQHFDNFFKSIK